MNKILLFLSAFVPLYFLILLKILINIIFHNLSFNILNTTTICVLFCCMLLGIIGAKKSLTTSSAKKFNVNIQTSQSITETYFLGYFSLFVLFALSYELETVSMFVVFVVIIVMIGIVYIKNDLYYINPFLNLLGYNFYEITYTEQDSDKTKTQKFLVKGRLVNTKQNFVAKSINKNFSLLEEK